MPGLKMERAPPSVEPKGSFFLYVRPRTLAVHAYVYEGWPRPYVFSVTRHAALIAERLVCFFRCFGDSYF